MGLAYEGDASLNRDPIRVYYIIDNLHMGGTQHHLVEVLAHLDPKRVSPCVVCLQADRADLAPMVREMGFPFEIFNLKKCYGPKAWIWVFKMAARLSRERVEIVHTYLLGANMVGILAAWMARVPVRIATRRGTGSNTLNRLHLLAWSLFNSFATCIVAVANALRDQTISLEQLPHSKVVTIYNGVDLDRFKPVDISESLTGSLPNVKELGVVANLFPWKGHRDLLEASARLVKKGRDLRLIFVGDGPLRRELEQITKDLGLERRVTFAGMVEDVRSWIAKMDIVVQASTGEEGLSNAILEAMAMAKPVVASRYGGNPELVVHGETGWLFPPGDREALYQILSEAIDDMKQTRNHGLAGRARVEAGFGLDTMIRKMIGLYETLLNGVRPSVAFVIPNMEIGGAETDVLNLSRGLLTKSGSVAVVARGGKLLEELRKDGVACFEIPMDARSLISIVRAAWSLSGTAMRENWGILNAQSAYTTITCALCRLFMVLRGKLRLPTLITTIHAIGRKEDTRVDRSYLRPVRWILRTLPRRVIFESYYEMNQVFPERAPPFCTVIHNGVADRYFDSTDRRDEVRSSLGIAGAGAIIGIVAALIPLKGHRYFLEGAAYVVKQFPKIRFLIIGDGPERANLEKMARQLELDNHVLFLGPRRDVERLLSAMDIFVLASLRESFPLSIREAMAMGCPVVATQVGGIPELIHDGETGYLVPPADGIALGKALVKLLADPELRCRVAENGRREAAAKYGIKYWIRETEQWFWKPVQ
jgi:glycosyltransferase involved in cell wall biosynthesis